AVSGSPRLRPPALRGRAGIDPKPARRAARGHPTLQGAGGRMERMSEVEGRLGAMSWARPSWDLTRIVLGVGAIGGLVAASFWILRPFLPAVVWATMIVVATWPTLRTVQARLWGRRGLAVTVMTLAMLAVVVAPVAVGVMAVVEHSDSIVAWSKSLTELSV